MKKLLGFQTFCTHRSAVVQLPDYEVLTWITSALSWKKHNGELWMHTDSKGLAWMKSKGLDTLYDKILLTLDHLPSYINHHVFWAGAKLYALRETPTPCVSFDLDTIFWGQVPHYTEDVVTLHNDDLDWPCYEHNQAKFAGLEYDSEYWDWSLKPLNVGFLYIKDNQLKDLYTGKAISFMRKYSIAHPEKPEDERGYLDPMVFCEQRSLPMCAKLLHKTVKVAYKLTGNFHVENNPLVSHIWNSKETYRRCPQAREAFLGYLMSWVRCNFPKKEYLLKHLHNEATGSLIHSGSDSSGKLNGHCRILGDIGANSFIRDANVPVFRKATKGDILFFGEVLYNH